MLKINVLNKKKFFTPVVFILVLMNLSSIINYFYLFQNIRNNLFSTILNETNNMIYSFNSEQNILLNSINTMGSDMTIINTVDESEPDVLSLKSVSSRLNSIVASVSIVDNILLYFKNSDTVIDKNSVYRLETKSNMLYSAESNLEELKKNIFLPVYNNTYILMENFYYINKLYPSVPVMVSSLNSDNNISFVQVVVIYNNNGIKSLITPMEHNENKIYDILFENNFMFNNDVIEPVFFSDIKNIETKEIRHKKYILCNSAIRNTPFHLVAIIPYSEITIKSVKYRNIMIAIFLISLIICFAIAIISTKHNKRIFKNIIETNNLQSKQINDFYPYVQSEYVRKYLFGESNNIKTENYYNINRIIPPSKNYCVLFYDINFKTSSELNLAKEIQLIKFTIKNVIEEIYPQSFYVNIGINNICFILYSDYGSNEQKKIFDDISKVSDTILIKTLGYDLDYAFGPVVHSSSELENSFFEARNNIMIKKLDIQRELSNGQTFFPIEIETALSDAVFHGQIRIINSIFDIIIANNKNKPNDIDILNYLYVCFDRIFKKTETFPTPRHSSVEEYRQAFIRLANNNINNISLFEQIIVFINKELSNFQLSRNLIADKFNITEEYVSILFKKNLDDSFLSYITKKRIDLACELLITNSVLTIEEVAGMCGYPTILSFRRAFKKITGLLPSQYRKVNKIQDKNT